MCRRTIVIGQEIQFIRVRLDDSWTIELWRKYGLKRILEV